MLEPGDKVYNFPAIALMKGGDIKPIRLSEFEGKNIILFFYSIKRAKDVENSVQKFADYTNPISNAVVIGVNRNRLAKQEFLQQKYLFNTIFLEDHDDEISKLFSAYQRNEENSLGHLFVINGDRTLIAAWRNIRIGDTINSAMIYINEYIEDINLN